jgi:hypothetical protein
MRVLEKDCFMGLKTLTKLTIENCGIIGLPVGCFNGLVSLRFLEMSDNEIVNLDEGVFNGLPSLISISLSRNKLVTLPEGIFKELHNLQHIELDDNNIGSLPEKVFSNEHIVSISLMRNNLSFVPDKIFTYAKPEIVQLNGNPMDLQTLARIALTTNISHKVYDDWVEHTKTLKFGKKFKGEKELWWEPWCTIKPLFDKESLLDKIYAEHRSIYTDNLADMSQREVCKYLATVYEKDSHEDYDLIKKCDPDTDIGGSHFSVGDVIGFEYAPGKYHCFSRNDIDKDPRILEHNPYTRREWTEEQKHQLDDFVNLPFYVQTVNEFPAKKTRVQKCIDSIIEAFEEMNNTYVNSEIVNAVIKRATMDELMFNPDDVRKFNENPTLDNKICIVAGKIKNGNYHNDVYDLINTDERVIDDDTIVISDTSSTIQPEDLYYKLVDLQYEIMNLTTVEDMNKRMRLSRERDEILQNLTPEQRQYLVSRIDEEYDPTVKEMGDIIKDKL